MAATTTPAKAAFTFEVKYLGGGVGADWDNYPTYIPATVTTFSSSALSGAVQLYNPAPGAVYGSSLGRAIPASAARAFADIQWSVIDNAATGGMSLVNFSIQYYNRPPSGTVIPNIQLEVKATLTGVVPFGIPPGAPIPIGTNIGMFAHLESQGNATSPADPAASKFTPAASYQQGLNLYNFDVTLGGALPAPPIPLFTPGTVAEGTQNTGIANSGALGTFVIKGTFDLHQLENATVAARVQLTNIVPVPPTAIMAGLGAVGFPLIGLVGRIRRSRVMA
jgi:hypothetical protein